MHPASEHPFRFVLSSVRLGVGQIEFSFGATFRIEPFIFCSVGSTCTCNAPQFASASVKVIWLLGEKCRMTSGPSQRRQIHIVFFKPALPIIGVWDFLAKRIHTQRFCRIGCTCTRTRDPQCSSVHQLLLQWISYRWLDCYFTILSFKSESIFAKIATI